MESTQLFNLEYDSYMNLEVLEKKPTSQDMWSFLEAHTGAAILILMISYLSIMKIIRN